jgi:hypothetical protein
MKKYLVFILLNTLFYTQLYAVINKLDGTNSSGEIFKNYYPLSLQINVPIYNKGIYTHQYGNPNMRVESRNAPSINLGLDYHFNRQNKLSYHLGLLVTREPITILNLDIETKELSNLNNLIVIDSMIPISFQHTKYNYYNSYALPVSIEYKIPLLYNVFYNISIGYRCLYKAHQTYRFEFSNFDVTPESFVAAFQYESTNRSPFYHSFQFISGVYIFGGYSIFKINVIYNLMLQDLYKGSYHIKNLSKSPETGGTYRFRGNFIGLSIAWTLRKNPFQ